MRDLKVCLSPELLHLYHLEDKIVVVVDILRATSCITTAFAFGANAIIPVSDLEECKALQETGCMGAAERNGKKIDGFDLDNSPFSYMKNCVKNKTISLTTTNGTNAINKSKGAKEILIGCYLNKKALTDYLISKENDLLVVCAGWKGTFNLEDTLFAGALALDLSEHFVQADDSVRASVMLYQNASPNLLAPIKKSSHYQRLKNLNIERDIEFCLTQHDIYQAIPILEDHKLINMKLKKPISNEI